MRLIKVSDFVRFTFTLAVLLVGGLAAADVQATEVTHPASGPGITSLDPFLATTVWKQDFDSSCGLCDWSVQNGLWEVGIVPAPLVGPDTAASGQNVVGTALNTNYAPSANARLVSPPFLVPPASANPRLRYWEWFNLGAGDSGQVQISTDNGASWTTLPASQSTFDSFVWTRALIELNAYGDSTVRVSFLITADFSIFSLGLGWYIDDVVLDTGAYEELKPATKEGFESGLGDWSVRNGLWEVGVPTVGPGSAVSPPNAAGTVLSGNYTPNVRARLVSPPFTVAPISENPQLCYWQWFGLGSGDNGQVQISTDNGATWTTDAQSVVSDNSVVWTQACVDLSAYSDSTVRVSFLITSDFSNFSLGSGWYIDDVVLPVITSVLTEEVDGLLPEEYTLDQNYPNPFNPSTSINFALPRAGHVSLTIYNLLGQEVVRLVDRELRAGNYSIEWDSRNRAGKTVASGLYFYRLTANQFIETRKMMMLK